MYVYQQKTFTVGILFLVSSQYVAVTQWYMTNELSQISETITYFISIFICFDNIFIFKTPFQQFIQWI